MDNSVMDNTSGTTQTQAETQAQQERMLPQSQVNEIVGRAKQEAAERAVEAYKRQNQQQPSYSEQPNYGYNQSQKALSEDDVKRLTSEELARQRDQWAKEHQEKADADAAARIVNTYKEKIAPGSATLLATIKYKCPEGERVVQYPRHANLSFYLKG